MHSKYDAAVLGLYFLLRPMLYFLRRLLQFAGFMMLRPNCCSLPAPHFSHVLSEETGCQCQDSVWTVRTAHIRSSVIAQAPHVNR